MKIITKTMAILRGFVIWEADEQGIFYARSQNREDEDYGTVYKIIK